MLVSASNIKAIRRAEGRFLAVGRRYKLGTLLLGKKTKVAAGEEGGKLCQHHFVL